MKQVLLAINGETPSRKAFRYALDLSRRIRADLSILRFVKQDGIVSHLSASREKALGLGRFLEESFAKVAFAEEGMNPDPLGELLAEGMPDVAVNVTVSGGNPETHLKPFVESHHDVVLTILDSPGSGDQPQKLKKKLGVPLVVVKSDPPV